MKTKAFAWLSSTVVLASILAGCGVNPVSNDLTTMATSHLRLFTDGLGHARRFGYRLGYHQTVNFPSFSYNNFSANLPAAVDLRQTGKISPVYDQGDLGACTAFAMGKGLRETLTNLAGAPAESYSALYLYYKERELENTVDQDSGAYLHDGMNVLKNDGECLDATMPYDTSKFTQKPSAQAEQEAANFKIDTFTALPNLQAMKEALAAGHPCVFGFTVYQSFMTQQVAETGMMPMPQPGEQVEGGHAVMIVGYNDAKQVLIIKNSWGTNWGDNGYFYMPYAYVTPNNVDEIYTATAHD